MGRFIVLVIDSFGVGYMDDVPKVRPKDIGANTCGNILKRIPDIKISTLINLGLINALGYEFPHKKFQTDAVYGKSKLMHEGGDTFYGHQEIMGTKPRKPKVEPFSEKIDKVFDELVKNGFEVQYYGEKLKLLIVNKSAVIGDNIEADLGQAYNVTATLDKIDFDLIKEIGRIVRSVVEVPRVIAFGGENVSLDNILAAKYIKEDQYVGINAPESGVYKKGYNVIHLGYGINPEVQVPTILGKSNIPVILIGKVADIVENRYGESIPAVDTEEVMELLEKEILQNENAFICANVQETDLAGHEENVVKYAEKLEIVDKHLRGIIEQIKGEDILIVCADHGNDPTIGYSNHTREFVPILIYKEGLKNKNLGVRETLSDIGATVADYFCVDKPENGQSFLDKLDI